LFDLSPLSTPGFQSTPTPNNKEHLMSNVIPLRSSSQAANAGLQPHPDASNPVAALVATIDKALGDTWSFDLVHHEVVGDETIVFASLVIDGKHRIGIGGTSVKGSLVDRLNAATLDALTRAGAWMGIAATTATVPQATPEPEPASPAEAGSRITRKQLDYAISLARDRGVARDKLAARCLAEFQRKPEYLSRAQASELIESLKKEAA
jgi:hypothetical protein